MILALVGCRGPQVPLPEANLPKGDPKDEPLMTRTVNSAGGQLDRRSDDGTGSLEWSIEWESAQLEYTSDQKFGGRMKNVKGVLYDKGKPASTFVAIEAVADKGSSKLRLVGGVRVTSTEPKGALFCGELVYDGIAGIIDAKKGIEVDYETYQVRGIEALRADSNLVVVATPESFTKKP